jgi:hypothetical protein
MDAFSQDWNRWMVFIHPPIVVLLPRILLKRGQSNGATDCTTLVEAALVPNSVEDADRLYSSNSNVRENTHTSLRSGSSSPIMEDTSTICMASFRNRLQTTGFSSEVCDVLMASWREKRYKGPWKW